MGHDVAAAAAMGHLRGVLRAVVWEAEDADPGAVLARVDRLVQGLRVAALATMVYARAVRPTTAGRAVAVHVANAGHPPMLLRDPARAGPDPVDGVTGLLVGVDDRQSPRDARPSRCPAGSTLIAYTDGLIEHPGQDMDQGIARAVRTGRARTGRRDAAASCATPRVAAPSTTGTTSR